MYKVPVINNSKLKINNSTQGEPIELKIEKMISGKEPITNGVAPIYTERKEGVRASTNIRTDRWLVAVEGADKIAKSYKARREERMKTPEQKAAEAAAKSAGAESAQGTQQAQK